MISNLIVFSSLLMAGWFTLQYLLKPQLRKRVEQPKYAFLRQLSMYDMQTGVGAKSSSEDLHEIKSGQVEPKPEPEHRMNNSSGETE